MPAVTTDDILSLSRIGAPDLASTERAVISVTTAPAGFEGEGFPVKRAFQGVDLAHLDPFIHLDQMGEVEYAPGEPKGTPWHPHRGFETVTYMIDGIMEHQDSEGGGGVITNGDTQWMTAGRAAAGAPRRVGRPVPRFSTVGQPPIGTQVASASLPGHPWPGGHAADHAGWRSFDPLDCRLPGRPRRPW